MFQPAVPGHGLRGKLASLTALAVMSLSIVLVPAGSAWAVKGDGGFSVRCDYSHSLPDDPIVYPGQPGASHMHDFFGATTVDAYSTPDTLVDAQTTCLLSSDSTGYWAPQTLMNGVPVAGRKVLVYYSSAGFSSVQDFPSEFQILAGNAHATAEQSTTIIRYTCGIAPPLNPQSPRPYDCTPYLSKGSVGVVEEIMFPNCWDGTITDGNYTPHVAYPLGLGVCPAGFPIALPRISYHVFTGIVNPLNADGSTALSLASGAYFTLHADFMNGWQPAEIQSLIDTCLNAHVLCRQLKDPPPVAGIHAAPARISAPVTYDHGVSGFRCRQDGASTSAVA